MIPTENLSGIPDDHKNYEECERQPEIMIRSLKRKAKTKAEGCGQSGLDKIFSSQPHHFRANKIIFITIKILMTVKTKARDLLRKFCMFAISIQTQVFKYYFLLLAH